MPTSSSKLKHLAVLQGVFMYRKKGTIFGTIIVDEKGGTLMGNFDKVIGYDAIKGELEMVLDMIKNKERYERLGAKIPRGIMLCGRPGVGKTLMAQSFIRASGLKSYTLRRNQARGNFTSTISKVFEEAKANAPAILLLDDLDKFADTDKEHPNAEEYVAVQAAMDSIRDEQVIVFATINELRFLPTSLRRAGRFDVKLKVENPTLEDASKIIKYYLRDKQIDEGLNYDDLSKMIDYRSCAQLESTINNAAIFAGYEGKDKIEMEHIVKTVMKEQMGVHSGSEQIDERERRERAYHEAGHLVVAEVLKPGIVGMAAINSQKEANIGGFVRKTGNMGWHYDVMTALGGKVATELRIGRCASGCKRDLINAQFILANGIEGNGICGVNMVAGEAIDVSDRFKDQAQSVVAAEMQNYINRVRELLVNNGEFLDKVAEVLMQKEVLLSSEIGRIKEGCQIKAMGM